MTIPAERKRSHGIGTPLVRSLLFAGIALMIAGELFCFFGPEAHARLRDTVCHMIFYSGAALISGTVIFYRVGRR